MVRKKNIKNIIFIIADTLRADYLGVYNSKITTTPNIDNLAKNAVVFTNAYTSITKTDPSITSIMSGRYPLSIGLINHGRDVSAEEENNSAKIATLPEILKKAGFNTAAIDWLSRWHTKGYKYYSYHISKNNQQHKYDKTLFRSVKSHLRFLDALLVKSIRRDFILKLSLIILNQWKAPFYDPADVIASKAIEIFKKNLKKNFLYIHFWDPHDPHYSPRKITSSLLMDTKSTYSAEIEFLDKELGKLLNFLSKSGKLDESLIIFTSDHGENFNEHDLPLNHEGLYQDVVKIPLIIKIPGYTANQISIPIQQVDILPTVLNLLDIPTPTSIDGKSLLPLINKKQKKIREYIYFEDIVRRSVSFLPKYRKRGIMIGQYKYIEKIVGDAEVLFRVFPREDLAILNPELYNLAKDPLEKKNIYHKKPFIANKLKKHLRNLTSSINKKRLIANPLLNKKVNKTKTLIQKAVKEYGLSNSLAIAWKGGKDTTTMMHIIKSIYGNIPFRIFFNDTTLEFKETYKFIEKMQKLWNLDLIVLKHDSYELDEYYHSKNKDRKKELSRLMKITAINKALKKYKFKGFMLGIRKDENPARKNEKYFSERIDHIRIHPLLDWTEEDVWEYMNIFGVPYNELYDKGYRSVGEQPFTQKSQKSERSGRDQEKERAMETLREMGYW